MQLLVLFSLAACAVFTVHAEKPTCLSGRLDLVLVIDVSGSNEDKFISNRDSALEIAKSLPISWDKATIAVIQYSRLAIMKLQFGSSVNWEVVNDTISTLEWTGDVSQTAEAMDLAMIQFRRSRPDAERVIVLFSDGNSFNSWQQVLDTAERLKYSESKIFAVSLAGDTYETELKQYVQHSNGSIIRRQSEFQQLKKELLDMTFPRCPSPAAKPPPEFLPPVDEIGPQDNGESFIEQLPTRRPTTVRAVIRTRITPRTPRPAAGRPLASATPRPAIIPTNVGPADPNNPIGAVPIDRR